MERTQSYVPRQEVATPQPESADQPVNAEGGTSAAVVPSAPLKDLSADKRLKGLVARKPAPRFGERQAFVILNTDKGFVPNTVRLYRGGHYVLHVVNVNEAQKNVSFMLDAFKQHHATYYGKIKSFAVDAEQEGVFSFMCPETSSEGKIVVLGNGLLPPVDRSLSSEDDKQGNPGE
jgi:hypothetical protein